jgi:hypothetical protein
MQALLTLLFPVLLAGCSSKQRFGYPIPSTPSSNAAGRTVEVLPVSGTRTSRLIDGRFSTNLLAEVRKVIGKELERERVSANNRQ